MCGAGGLACSAPQVCGALSLLLACSFVAARAATAWWNNVSPQRLLRRAGLPDAAAVLASAPALPGVLLALATAAAGFGAGRWGGARRAGPGASPAWPADEADWDAAAAASPVQGVAVDPAAQVAYSPPKPGSVDAQTAAGEPAGAAAALGIPPPEQVYLTGVKGAIEPSCAECTTTHAFCPRMLGYSR